MKNDDLGYCMAPTPSKFPYPYTIAKGQPQIRHFNDLYHPTCFKASGISDIAAKDMKNYESLTDEEKRDFDELFKPKKRRFEEDESTVASKDNEEPLTKKKKSLDEETGTENVEQEVTTI
uniref:Uncharacterized protein n=1 Tax=Panagrolaimus davidi TaxID=227884 RepID=A0A914PQ30_9BILA